jgi:hypothetical protein
MMNDLIKVNQREEQDVIYSCKEVIFTATLHKRTKIFTRPEQVECVSILTTGSLVYHETESDMLLRKLPAQQSKRADYSLAIYPLQYDVP